MSTIQPEGERLRQAIKWISDERIEDDNKDIVRLITDASMRFNLSPKEEVFLRSFYQEQ